MNTGILSVLILSLLFITACGGSNNEESSPVQSQFSGLAQKGAFKSGSSLKAIQSENGIPSDSEASSEVSSETSGWEITVPWEGVTTLEVTGNYFNECKGNYSQQAMTLKSYATATQTNINLYSHLAYVRTAHLITQGNSFSTAHEKATTELKALFSFSRSPAKLDIYDGSTAAAADNAGLLLFSAAFSCDDNAPALLAELGEDFADNGLFDSDASEKFRQIQEQAGTEGFFRQIRDHLIHHGVSNPPEQSDLEHAELPGWVISPVTTPPDNQAPTVSGVSITDANGGIPGAGDKLTGVYTYADAESDAEGSSTFRWLRDGVAIAGATTQLYTPLIDDEGTNISFEVAPVATAGTTTGTALKSTAVTIGFSAKDALYTDHWYLQNTGTAPATWGKFKDLTAGADMRVKGAWDRGVTGKNIVVTVVDDGIDFTHPDLAVQEKSGFGYSQELGNANVAQPSGNHRHGTGVAGVIAARTDADGVVGIAPRAQLIGHRILDIVNLDNNSTHTAIKMLQDDVSQVSNHSYGPDDDGKLHPQPALEYDSFQALVENANEVNGVKKGHVVLFASGNGRAYVPRKYEPSEVDPGLGTQFDFNLDIKKNLGDYAGLDISQQHPYVLSVSGFDANDKEVTYAEAGPATLVAGATGNRIPAPDATDRSGASDGPLAPESPEKKPAAALATTGRANVSYVTTESHRDGGTDEPAGYDMSFNGTSAAAPTVAGVVALIRSANPDLSWRDVRWILAKTARKIQPGGTIINQATGKASTGSYAKAIWSASGNSTFGKFSHYFGYGAVNATAAVSLAQDSSYTLLPEMKTCKLTVTANNADLTTETCPGTLEFVQVKYTVKGEATINDLSLSMTLAGDADKTIHLIAPSTCSARDGCGISADTSVRGGTVGFMGDSLQMGSGEGFQFEITDSAGNLSDDIAVSEVMVFGFDANLP